MQTKQITFDDQVVRYFSWATIIWGVVALLLGVIVAMQMAFWQTNMEPWFTFGRLRPLHTNAAIFAFVGNSMFAGMYYSTQRLLKTRMASDFLSWFHFWGWQFIIVGAAITLPLGLTQSKEYAELIWPLDIAIAVVWVLFAVNYFWTLAKRNEKQIYVAIWFYIASILTVGVLHIVNNLSLPTSWLHSYSLFTGVQDALVQWWYGHNAVAFFLTTPILGLMYYYVPKAVNRPIYSYRLSVIHFWALIFLYIWAGPHHLLYSALPDWAQMLGVIFSIALWAPSWGGMINGLLTLRGAWDKLRTDPIVKFLAASITFYGMSTLEGPLLSIKTINALAHNTDWIIGHVHGGTLGWNGFMAAGVLYWMVPRLYKTELYSQKLANFHFWIGLFGILLYISAMWASGLTQGLMWRALTDEGTLLYPNFLEAISKSQLMYMMRLIGGILYLATFCLMAFNLFKTMRSGKAHNGAVDVVIDESLKKDPISWKRLIFSPTMGLLAIGLILMLLLGTHNIVVAVLVLTLLIILVVAAAFLIGFKVDRPGGHSWHHALEGRALLFTVLTLVAILIGGAVQIIPAVAIKEAVPIEGKATPYEPLELVGRDIYIREGCYTCHTQMVRTLMHEVLRYGPRSEAWEYVYDTPFQWGSKRTGPDLHRLGGKYPNLWHYKHMIDPRSTSAGSIMPNYSNMQSQHMELATLPDRMRTLQKIGVPYTDEEVKTSIQSAKSQAKELADSLAKDQIEVNPDAEILAIIAYLQRLGKDMKDQPKESQQ